jgi:hypothetical protein
LGRIFPSPALRRAVIIALAHPVSQESRCILSMHLHQQYQANEQKSVSLSWHLPSEVALKANLFKQGLRGCLLQQPHQQNTQSYQKFATLSMYSIHGILQTLFQDFKNADISTGALKLETFLIAAGFMPNQTFVDLLRFSSTHSDTIVGGEEDLLSEQCLSGDFLTLSELILLRKPLYSQNQPLSLDLEPLVQNFVFIVQHPQQYSIANLQAACQLLAYICHIVICAGDVAGEVTGRETTSSEFSNCSSVTSERSPETIPDAVYASVNSSTEPTAANNNFRYLLSDRLDVLGQALQSAVRSAASTLLARAESSFAEMLLILIREEIDRFQGRSWKELHAKMFSEKGLIFPHSPQSHSDVMGLDFLIPISHVETMRKEVQIFLMLRAVLHYLSTSLASFGDGKLLPFEFGTFLLDCAFLSLEDESIVPSHLRSGSQFDMKGKKFLDSTVLVPNTPANATSANDSISASSSGGKSPVIVRNSSSSNNHATSHNNTSNSNSSSGTPAAAVSSNAPNASSSSIFSFGLFGKSSSNSNIANSVANNNRNGGSTGTSSVLLSGVSLGQKLLFVQDAHVLQLITASKIDGKSVFKVHVVAPLLYVDAKLDMHNKKRLKLVVRSYKTSIPGMRKMDLSFPSEEGGMNPGSTSQQNHSLLGNHVMMSSSSGHNPIFLLSASSSSSSLAASNSGVPSAFGPTSGSNSPPADNNKRATSDSSMRPVVFLKPVRKAAMYEVDLLMDTEQAASLAMQHVENRRRQLQQQKVDECKKKMQYWLSDRRHWSDCIPNSES